MSKNKIYAAIDIGSNAARLLIKELTGIDDKGRPELKKLILVRVPLRLGIDVFEKDRITKPRRENLLRLMKAYRQLLKIYDVDDMRACATSAMRDADNGKEIISEIKRKTDIPIEIIDGEEEARIVFNNRLECTSANSHTSLFMDVGGGSTELNLLSDCELKYSGSFNIGTVRTLAGRVTASERNRFITALKGLKSTYGDISLIGSGGNINKIYKMSPEKDAETKSIPISELNRLLGELKPLSVEERMARYDLKPDRADVIVPAAEIFLTAAEEIGCDRIEVPMIGVSDGIIDGLVMRDR